MKGFHSTPEIAWHYTDGTRLLPLIKSRILKLRMGVVLPGEQPVVWFTKSDIYEPTAYPSWLDASGKEHVMKSQEEVAQKANGLVRIGISAQDSCLKRFSHWTKSRLPEHLSYAEELIKTAQNLGSDPEKDWLVSYKPVSESRWLHIQIAFPQDVGADGAKVWNEWDLRAQYTKDLLNAKTDECDLGQSCECC